MGYSFNDNKKKQELIRERYNLLTKEYLEINPF